MEKYVGKEGNSVYCSWVNSEILFKERSKKMSSGKLCLFCNGGGKGEMKEIKRTTTPKSSNIWTKTTIYEKLLHSWMHIKILILS